MSSARTANRVAVLVRGHCETPKLSSLLRDLSGERPFDFYALVNETRGVIDVGDCKKISFSERTPKELGFDVLDDTFLVQCTDLLFAHAAKRQPQYDFYIMVEYDVEFSRQHASFMDQFVATLLSPEFVGTDLIGSDLSRRTKDWYHFGACSKYFADVWGVFFPFVVMSRKAIDALLAWRTTEEGTSAGTADRVFCEALVPTVLHATGHKMLDLNSVMPECYDTHSMYFGLPMLHGALIDRRGGPVTGEFFHPVYDEAAYLEKHWWAAQEREEARIAFAAKLADRSLPLSDKLRADYSARMKLDGAN